MKKYMTTTLCILSLAVNVAGCKGNSVSQPSVQQEISSQNTTKADTIKADTTKADTTKADTTKTDAAKADTAKTDITTTDTAETNTTETTVKENPLVPNAVGWSVQKYSDRYLSYEIPETWAKSEKESSDEHLFVFFQSQSPKTQYPSNLNLQITQLNTGEQSGIDYGDPQIQEEFHQFLIQDMGLPQEAKSGNFSVSQTKAGIYIFQLSFERKAMDGTMVQQTIFLPMNMKHSIVIWATDFREGAEVSADEAARHLCETLRINE